MNALFKTGRMTSAEYLHWESEQETKHEFVDGEVFAMVGVRKAHNLITGNAFSFLKQALRGRACQVFFADLKLQIDEHYFYPDVMASCDPRDTAGPNDKLSISHPWLVVEVLSASTEAFDRGGKFALYRQVDTLTHYLLVEQGRPAADLFSKNPQGQWVLQPLSATDTIRIEQPHTFDWPVASLFEGVSFEPEARPEPEPEPEPPNPTQS